MGDSPHQVTHQAGTTSATGDRLQKLEERLADAARATGEAACEVASSIQDTVQSATGSVREAAGSVVQAVDLRRQVQEHPWLVMGGSVALGFLAAHLLKASMPATTASPWMGSAPVRPSGQESESGEQREAQARASTAQESAGLGKSLGELGTWLGGQLNEVKGFAATAIMNYVHSLVARGLDTVQQELGERGGTNEGRETERPEQPSEPLQGPHF